MDKTRLCKICNRRFTNGKAMGGHMRSHLAKLPLPPKPTLHQLDSSSSSSLSYPSSTNPLQSYRSVNHELPFMSSKPNPSVSVTVATTNGNGESATDSLGNINPTRTRSKRRRKSVEKVAESSPEQVSSISDIFIMNEEDVAMCLLMLSNDKRTRIKQVYKCMEEEVDQVETEAENEADDEDESFGVIPERSRPQYKCGTCKRGFRSYQALGGHKASHKRIKTHTKEDDYGEGRAGVGGGIGHNSVADVSRKIFKCHFCDKVFDSGQALGGHKKVHFSYLGIAQMSSKSGDNMIDLNLPAPEDDGEVDQAELSTLSKTKAYHLRN